MNFVSILGPKLVTPRNSHELELPRTNWTSIKAHPELRPILRKSCDFILIKKDFSNTVWRKFQVEKIVSWSVGLEFYYRLTQNQSADCYVFVVLTDELYVT